MRVLLIAEAANPEWVSVPLEGWSHSRAIAGLVDAHLVTQVRNRAAIERAGAGPSEFTAIDSEAVARRAHGLATFLRGGPDKAWTMAAAVSAITYPYFEHLVWKRFGPEIRAGGFDVVHRLIPLSPTAPSPIARRCAAAGVPFVAGPLNGGVPWPRGFDSARRREKEWLSYFRGAYRLLPGVRSTRRHAAALIVGSRDTLAEMPGWVRPKCVYIPENAVDPSRFRKTVAAAAARPVRVVFVGRLVPYKGADMLLEAAAPLVKDGRVVVEIIGDGPEMPSLRGLVERLGIGGGVSLRGWVAHRALEERLIASDVFAFPSIREFGGAVVLEAMAVGLVPVVVGYGGPGELVSKETGIRVPIGSRVEITRGFREVLTRLADAPETIRPMGLRGRERVMRHFTWEAKARQVLEVYRWVCGLRPKPPDFGGEAASEAPVDAAFVGRVPVMRGSHV
ncbi:MAG: glycosyltransferase family 4 protein [Phycisphaerales bacterium]